jgi:hypothetical protein
MRTRRPPGGPERAAPNPLGRASSADYRPSATHFAASNCIIFKKAGRLAIREQ